MELIKNYEITFDTEESILCACPLSVHEWVMLLSSGVALKYNAEAESVKELFTVDDIFDYDDGGFDLSAQCSIYAMGDVVVVVNDFKTHGYLYYEGRYSKIHFSRDNYYARISRYPIALFKDPAGIPHLIYAHAWNHIQVMNLDTRQILTAAKSLIEIGAEESHIQFYKQHPEDSKYPWPRPYDYFFGELLMSPGNTYFLSKGWVWGSADSYNVYDVADFIKSNRISEIQTGHWEHSNRPACWIDDHTVAVAYNPFEVEDDDDEEPIIRISPRELHFYDVSLQEKGIVKKIVFEGENDAFAQIYFSQEMKVLIGCGTKGGVTIYNLEGEAISSYMSFAPDKFYPELSLFTTVKGKTISIHTLI